MSASTSQHVPEKIKIPLPEFEGIEIYQTSETGESEDIDIFDLEGATTQDPKS